MGCWLGVVLVPLVLGACAGPGPAGPPNDIGAADVRVLFVGNSLTYTHDVPGLVQALADRSGRSMSHGTIARPNYALEDHWNDGIGREIGRLRPDFVVMQQGPSSLPESRTHLVAWTRTLAGAIREAGGEPALYMVWPEVSRRAAFGAVRESYEAAAAEVNGRFIPAGAAWLELWARDEDVELYGPDGFHPSYLGALVAAHAIFAVLFDADPMQTPALPDGVASATLQQVREAVRASLATMPKSGVTPSAARRPDVRAWRGARAGTPRAWLRLTTRWLRSRR